MRNRLHRRLLPSCFSALAHGVSARARGPARLRSDVLCAVVAVGGFACATPKPAPAPAPPPPPTVDASSFSAQPSASRLVLLHLSDSEAGLIGDAGAKGVGGLARTEAVLRSLKEHAVGNVLTVHAGDTFIPSPELRQEIDGQRAILAGNNKLGLDVSGLGNHEFDEGETLLAEAIKGATFPYLSSTVEVRGGPLLAVRAPAAEATPWVTDLRGKLAPRAKACAGTRTADGCDGLVVGIVGATTEELRRVSAGATSNVVLPHDLLGTKDAIQRQVDALHTEGIHVVLLLSHLQGGMRERQLVEELGLTGVDVIVSGGGEARMASKSMRLLAGEVPDALCGPPPAGFGEPCFPALLHAKDNKPVLLVATGGDFMYVGRLVVDFDATGEITQVDAKSSRPFPVDEETLLELRASVNKELLAFEQRVQTELLPLGSVIAETAFYLEGAREAVRNRETNLGDLSADSIAWAARLERPDVAGALRNGGGIRNGIGTIDPKTGAKLGGPVRIVDVGNALRFDGDIVVVDITHAELVRTVESALRGAGTSRGQFPQLSSEMALVYTTDAPEQTLVEDAGKGDGKTVRVLCPGARVRSLRVGGLDVVKNGVVQTPKAHIAIATIGYLADGGDGWFPGEPVSQIGISGHTEQSALISYLTWQVRSMTWRAGGGYQDPTPSTARRIRAVDARVTTLPIGCTE